VLALLSHVSNIFAFFVEEVLRLGPLRATASADNLNIAEMAPPGSGYREWARQQQELGIFC
jgi:hypothetical protein